VKFFFRRAGRFYGSRFQAIQRGAAAARSKAEGAGPFSIIVDSRPQLDWLSASRTSWQGRPSSFFRTQHQERGVTRPFVWRQLELSSTTIILPRVPRAVDSAWRFSNTADKNHF
jgi:hypothetical protein